MATAVVADCRANVLRVIAGEAANEVPSAERDSNSPLAGESGIEVVDVSLMVLLPWWICMVIVSMTGSSSVRGIGKRRKSSGHVRLPVKGK